MKNCLLLEDDTFMSRYIEIMLRSHRVNVICCKTVAQARNLIENEKVDVAVLDGLLPDGSGIDFANEIDCPVIFVTGVTDEHNKKKMWKRGILFSKPLDSSFNECFKRIHDGL